MRQRERRIVRSEAFPRTPQSCVGQHNRVTSVIHPGARELDPLRCINDDCVTLSAEKKLVPERRSALATPTLFVILPGLSFALQPRLPPTDCAVASGQMLSYKKGGGASLAAAL